MRFRSAITVLVAVTAVASSFGSGPSASAEQFGQQPKDDVVAAAANHLCGGLNAQQLAAMAIAVTFNETGAGSSAVPSPMTLSRYDTKPNLYAPGSAHEDKTQPFWNPGVGVFQLDSAGLGNRVGAHQAINVRSAAEVVVTQIAKRYCQASGSASAKRTAAWRDWYACRNSVCEGRYNNILVNGTLSMSLFANVSSDGGMVAATCKRGGATFACWRVDPAVAQGHTAWRTPGFGNSPITDPFYEFVSSNGGVQYEERHWIDGATSLKAVRKFGTDARDGMAWSSSDITVIGVAPPVNPPTPLPRRAALSAGRDYNEDGKDDIFWYGGGDTADSLWFGKTPAGQFDKGAVTDVGGDYLPVAGDFNGDGQADVFWYSPGSGAEYVWYHYTGRSFVFGPPKNQSGDPANVSGRYTPVPGDFNGDGRDDIFWYASEGGPESVWYGRDDARFTVSSAPQVARSGLRPIPGDFEGDHRTDIFWYAPGSDPDALWRGSASSAKFLPVSIDNVTGSYSPVAGDFNGDGKDDIYWYALGADNDSLWSFTGVGTYTSSSTHDAAGLFIPIAGDFDGNGRDDIFWYCPGTYDDFAWYFTSTGKTSTNQTVNGDYRPT